jgi:hypothetical protein
MASFAWPHLHEKAQPTATDHRFADDDGEMTAHLDA